MKNLPFNSDGLTPSEIVHIYEAFKTLQEKFTLERTGSIDFKLADFEAFKNYDEVIVRDSYTINGVDRSYIMVIETYKKIVWQSGEVDELREYHVWALTYLKQDMGKIRIRPETFRDKIVELITPLEIDFKDDKAFSDKFYVVADNDQKAAAGITQDFRNAVMAVGIPDIVIEINNQALVIGSTKGISPEKSICLAEFVSKVNS
ncbi:hypothetical protein DJ568_11995 [Mucilaginibacter hurinus]|uniref:Uncharacterized protein n=1 Tax=Mucilaginibacter hurinus TaxID=2201324 RepID=A0A367GNW4_9SPHI|nr:hypothetical protein [Mucilaginibacter hurinus]RCH54536.1 hypothetical protein DJ568_11995 [Mucilaginibacter hurinus]